jgi:hypothetical protein
VKVLVIIFSLDILGLVWVTFFALALQESTARIGITSILQNASDEAAEMLKMLLRYCDVMLPTMGTEIGAVTMR